MGYCNNCGNEVNEGEAFCAHCGTPTTVQNNTYSNTTQKKNSKPVIIISVLVALIAAVVVTILVINGGNKLIGTWYSAEDDYEYMVVTKDTISIHSYWEDITFAYTLTGNTINYQMNGMTEKVRYELKGNYLYLYPAYSDNPNDNAVYYRK